MQPGDLGLIAGRARDFNPNFGFGCVVSLVETLQPADDIKEASFCGLCIVCGLMKMLS